MVEVHSDDLDAIRSIYVHSFDLSSLAALFSDLADSWSGWEGEKSWHSIEHELLITAASDNLGHCLLTFTLQNGPNYTWRAIVGGFIVDAGEEMAAVAREISAWVDKT